MNETVARRVARRIHARRTHRPISWVFLFLVFVLCVSSLLIFAPFAVARLQAAVAPFLFSPEKSAAAQGSGLVVLDRNGDVLFEFTGDDGTYRYPVPLDAVSPHLINATIAAEDADFWENPGISVRGLLRAAYENLAFWEYGGFFRGTGGSSLTQQLARNLYMSPEQRAERSLVRKAREMLFAMELNRRYSKEQILEWYLNHAFYGNNAQGIEAAAQRYFGKHASELSLAEATMLAGIPNAPAIYDPINNPEYAKARQEQVLALMVHHRYISAETAQAALAEPLVFHQPARSEAQALHFVMYVRDLLPRILGPNAPKGGLRVITTLDPRLQMLAEQTVRTQIARLRPRFNATNAALVALDPATGEVLAMVGSPDYFDESIQGQVNNAIALNQPGSAIKPITYLAAFMKGWAPSTIVEDSPLWLNDGLISYRVGNFDNRYRGRLPVRRALGNSLNVPAIRALQFAGLPEVHALARRMGLTTLRDLSNYGLSFTIGGVDATLLDMSFAFSVFANNGEQVGMPSVLDLPPGSRPLDPVAVLRVEDAAGRVLWEYTPARERIVPAPYTYLVTHVLADPSARTEMFGTALNLPDGRPAAVKTGLTDGPRDTWAIGYTPQLLTGVWVGNHDNAPMPNAASSATSGVIWREFMAAALAGQPALPFDPPPGVVFMPVCASTGLPPSGRTACRDLVTEVFVAEHAPRIASPAPPPSPAPAPQPQPSQGGQGNPRPDDDDRDNNRGRGRGRN